MSKSNVKRDDQGQGTDFINSQRSKDEAKNEKMKSEKRQDRIAPEQSNRRSEQESSNVSHKGTGGGTHNTTGD